MNHVRGFIKAPLLALLIFTAIAVLASLTLLRIPRRRARVVLYRICMALTGMHVRTQGQLSPSPVLLVSNHCSYLDVILLGSREDIAFTPKQDVRAWPVIGALVALFGAVFVSRDPRHARSVQTQVQDALRAQRPVSLFAEGTTNNGRTLLPFKSSLFSLATSWEDTSSPLHIQPVSVRYDQLNGQPLNDAAWDHIAWYGEMDFFPHLWGFLSQKSMHATLIFHPAIDVSTGMDRKQLARQAHAMVASALPLPPASTSPKEDAA